MTAGGLDTPPPPLPPPASGVLAGRYQQSGFTLSSSSSSSSSPSPRDTALRGKQGAVWSSSSSSSRRGSDGGTRRCLERGARQPSSGDADDAREESGSPVPSTSGQVCPPPGARMCLRLEMKLPFFFLDRFVFYQSK